MAGTTGLEPALPDRQSGAFPDGYAPINDTFYRHQPAECSHLYERLHFKTAPAGIKPTYQRISKIGGDGGIRTHDLCLMKALLLPAKLHRLKISSYFGRAGGTRTLGGGFGDRWFSH